MNDLPEWAAGWSAPAPRTPAADAAPSPENLCPSHAQFLKEVQAESMGWQPLGEQAYLHLGAPAAVQEIQIVGIADSALSGHNVLLLNF